MTSGAFRCMALVLLLETPLRLVLSLPYSQSQSYPPDPWFHSQRRTLHSWPANHATVCDEPFLKLFFRYIFWLNVILYSKMRVHTHNRFWSMVVMLKSISIIIDSVKFLLWSRTVVHPWHCHLDPRTTIQLYNNIIIPLLQFFNAPQVMLSPLLVWWQSSTLSTLCSIPLYFLCSTCGISIPTWQLA